MTNQYLLEELKDLKVQMIITKAILKESLPINKLDILKFLQDDLNQLANLINDLEKELTNGK